MDATTADRDQAQSGAQWPLLGLTLLLAGLVVFQQVYLVPRSMYVVQHLAGHWVPAPLRVLASVPEWAALAAGLLLAALAVWQRGSVHRLTLLATVALAVNVGTFVAVVNSVAQILSLSRP